VTFLSVILLLKMMARYLHYIKVNVDRHGRGNSPELIKQDIHILVNV